VWRIAIACVLVGCGSDHRAARAQAAFDRYRQPDKLVAALGLHAGDVVADVGAGRGYLTHRLLNAVGAGGRVVATDIDFAALQQIAPAANLELRKVPPNDPSLEARGYDLILLSEVDQYLPDRVDYLKRLERALKPGGRIAVCNRRNYRAPLVEAARTAGLRLAGEYTGLPAHFLVFLETTS
jgi:ubiquinone/menaquinone biosynthesis C-methylase UbiE